MKYIQRIYSHFDAYVGCTGYVALNASINKISGSNTAVVCFSKPCAPSLNLYTYTHTEKDTQSKATVLCSQLRKNNIVVLFCRMMACCCSYKKSMVV